MNINNDISKLDNAYLSMVKDKRISSAGFKESCELIVKYCAQALKVSRVSIWLISRDSSHMSCFSLYNLDEDVYQDVSSQLTKKAFPVYFDALNSSRVIDANNAIKDSRIVELADSYLSPLNIKSMLDATLRTDDSLRGVLCFEMVGLQRTWSSDEKIFATSVSSLIDQKIILSELKKSQANYLAIFNDTSSGLLIFDGETKKFTEANPAACLLFGSEREELIGKSTIDFSPDFQLDGRASLEKSHEYVDACLNGKTQKFEWLHERDDGRQFYAEVILNPSHLFGKNTFFASFRDISEKKEAELQLSFRATHDSLTGLLNRDRLHSYIAELIDDDSDAQDPLKIALLLFDLNHFKEINDTLGHEAGDKVLKQISILLQSYLAKLGGVLFRLGGDEFVVVFNNRTLVEPIEKLPSLLTHGIERSLIIDEVKIELNASIGGSTYPDDGKNSQDLLRCADVAMYYAKQNIDVSPWYDSKNDLNNHRRLAMMVELGSAIRKGHLDLYFQPRINIITGNVTSCEALVRWHHPKHGMLLPKEFLPLIEMSEYIHPLADWVLMRLVKNVKYLNKKGLKIMFAMNISGRNLSDSRLTDSIGKILKEEDINPELLEIEITESALIKNPQLAQKNLQKINDLGISIAIDDYGTGYSSLNYLISLPVNTLKIDRYFIKDILKHDSINAIVSSTINLAHNLSLKVVAEGVENTETLEVLNTMNCDEVQGYLFAKPMPIDEFEQWLEEKGALSD